MIGQYPEVLALVLIALGIFVASLSAKWSVRGVMAFKSAIERQSSDGAPVMARAINHKLIARMVFYIVFGFFLLLALQTVGTDIVSSWLDVFIAYIPRMLVGLVIIFAGILLGQLTKSLVANLLPDESNQLLPRLSQYLVIIAAIVTGLGQMAIEVAFLATLILIVLAALLGSLSLAFALGARSLVANLLARRELEHYRIGDVLEVDSVSGTVVDLTRTAIVLECENGRMYIPASKLTDAIVLLRNTEKSS